MEINSTSMAAEQAAPEAEAINVKIVGHEMLSKKMFDIVMHILIENEVHTYDDCIRTIRFTEDEPEGRFGGFRPEEKEIVINLQSHFDYATDVITDGKLSLLGIRGHIWFGMITTSLHEILHAIAYAIDPETMMNTDRVEVEKNINEETANHRARLIRDYDVEPADMADEPFFGSRYMEFMVKKIKDNSEQWAINQSEIHETGFIWKHDDVVLNTFREWFRIGYNFSTDSEWDKEVAPLLSTEVVDDIVITTENPVAAVAQQLQEVIALPAGPVETAVEVIEKVAETATQPAGAEVVAAPTPEPLDIDPESLAALYNAEEPMDLPDSVDDYGTAGMMMMPTQVSEPAPVPVQQPVVAQPAVAPQTELPTAPAPSTEGRCRSCQAELVAGFKFCPHCATSVEETPMPDFSAGIVPNPTPAPQQHNPQYQQAPMATNLPNTNLSAEQIRACVGQIFMRCWHHIYTKCGFQPGQNPQFAPELRNAVAEPLSVVGIPCVEQILVAMDCTDQMGRYSKHAPVVNGMIRGKITKTQGLPSYTLYLNFNGIEVKRLILPQNMWKVNTQGNYSTPAQRAQQGGMIAWLIDGDDSTPGKKWKAKIENGNLEWLV